MKKKEINDIIVFMQNNNLDYKNIELLSNFCIFINKDYVSSLLLKNCIKTFERRNNSNQEIFYNHSTNINLSDILQRLRLENSNENVLYSFETEIDSDEENYENLSDEEYHDEEFDDPFN